MRVVLFCGGRGGAQLFDACVERGAQVTCIVNAYDDGESSGLLRNWAPTAPGWSDIRKNIARIRREAWWNIRVDGVPTHRPKWVGWQTHWPPRVTRGRDYHGALGNLVLHALWEEAEEQLPRVLERVHAGCRHQVLHVTANGPYLRLRARYADGRVATTEAEIVTPRGVPLVALETDFSELTLNPAVVEALKKASVVLYGPGSVYSSLLPTYATPGLADVLSRLTAPRLLVRNITTDDGGVTPEMGVQAQRALLGDAVTAVVSHEEALEEMRLEGR